MLHMTRCCDTSVTISKTCMMSYAVDTGLHMTRSAILVLRRAVRRMKRTDVIMIRLLKHSIWERAVTIVITPHCKSDRTNGVYFATTNMRSFDAPLSTRGFLIWITARGPKL